MSSGRPRYRMSDSGSPPGFRRSEPVPACPGVITTEGNGVRLRAWQNRAVTAFDAHPGDNFTVCATPGAGKTNVALTIAATELNRRRINQVIVVAPTDHLRQQWADAASAFGVNLDPTRTNQGGVTLPEGMHGYVTTYAQVAARAILHRHRTQHRRTLVVMDEVHHSGDGLSWGEAVVEAFDPALKRLLLTGTPFRSGAEEIPYIAYEDTDEGRVSTADVTYSYRDALGDGVCRPVVFAAYTGVARWRNSATGALADFAEQAHELGSEATREVEDRAWRVALDPQGQWIRHVIAAADSRLQDLRSSTSPDAAGLLLAGDQDTARAYAGIVHEVTGRHAVVAVSDDPNSSEKIHAFRTGSEPWIIAVRQVSEGTDIPRLSVLVYATNYRTPLFWQQAVGRVVRARNRRESATVFIPAVRGLVTLAAEMEADRNHVIPPPGGSDTELEVPEREVTDGTAIEHLGAEAAFAHVLHSGQAYLPGEGAEEHDDFLGLPGLLTPEQTAALLAKRDAELRRRNATTITPPAPGAADTTRTALWRDTKSLRRDISTLVSRLASRSGRSHADIHVELRREVPGPGSAQAGVDTLTRRRDWLLGQLH